MGFNILHFDDVISDVYTLTPFADLGSVPVVMEMPLFDRSVSSREEVVVYPKSGLKLCDVRAGNGKHV